ncbi:RHS protein [Caballeronia temeraria]|uniref:RHS protein n=1 Tax=Caballeronia temeraria TaxID=1777137 RepID=A0A158A5Y1_9BURK|nr:RHS protein [Caballeronia temeraria]
MNGAPEELTDASGEIVWRTQYQVWGNTVIETAAEHYQPQQNLRFQGQYLDRETGLHYNLFRYYDPGTGRFISPDPIGLAGGINLYAYAPNPVQWVDQLGLSCDLLSKPKKVVNSNMPHAVERAVERGVYPDKNTASDALKALSKQIEKDGYPVGTIADTAHADRVLVPTGNNGMAVYQVAKNGTAKIKTVLINLLE